MTRELFYLSSDQILITHEQQEAGVWSNFVHAWSNFDDARAFLPLAWSNFDDAWAFLSLTWSNFDHTGL